MSRVQTRVLTAVVAVIATIGGLTTLAGATSVQGAGTPARTSVPSADPVGERSATPEQAESVGATLQQTIRLDIRGGALTIEPATTSLRLDREGDVLRGALAGVTVVDARGTLDGWRARAQVVEVVGRGADGVTRRIPPGHVVITPGIRASSPASRMRRWRVARTGPAPIGRCCAPREAAVAGPSSGRRPWRSTASTTSWLRRSRSASPSAESSRDGQIIVRSSKRDYRDHRVRTRPWLGRTNPSAALISIGVAVFVTAIAFLRVSGPPVPSRP